MGDQKLLSQRFVDITNEPGKYFDKNGLFLRVKKGGSKKWVFRYSFNGKRPEMGLGNAKVIKLSRAREKALKALKLKMINLIIFSQMLQKKFS